VLNNLSFIARNKTGVFLLVLSLIVGGVGAQATGLLNTDSGGYLLCVNSTTKVVTHPGTSSCPKGSKKLVLGAQGAAGTNGLTGAAGIAGKDGKTLWNGVKDPENTWGAPGDMFINSVTKTLFGPKDLITGWPAGVSMVGPKGDQGLRGTSGADGASGPAGATGPKGDQGTNGTNGTNGTTAITELFLCDGPDAGTVADEKCKIGMTGPGGGFIFFVDYNDQYAGFNYLEVAPTSCEAQRRWSSSNTSIPALTGWSGRAVGSGASNTQAIKNLFNSDTPENNAAYFATACSAGGKSDWFLGSLGEMKLLYDNLQGPGEFVNTSYLTSSEYSASAAWTMVFSNGDTGNASKSNTGVYFRPIRSF